MKRYLLFIGLAALLFVAPACLEDFFSTDEEEELNQDMVGIWYRYVVVEDGTSYGLPALVKLFDDGSGTIESYDDAEQDEPNVDSFTWQTDAETFTVIDENDSTLWSGSYTLTEDNSVVHFTYTQDGQSYEEIYVKYSGDKDPEMVGTWIMVTSQIGTEEPLSVERVVFNQDGSGTDYFIEDLEVSSDVEIGQMTWNSNGGYLVVFGGDETVPMVVKYTITDGVFNANDFTDDGQEEAFTFVKDIDGIDQQAVGTWTMTSVKIAGYLNPIPGLQVSLDLSADHSGAWVVTTLAGTDSSSFNWKTNGGYVFIYDEETPMIAWVQEYTLSGNTLILKTDTDYYEGYGWVSSEYTFTRAK